MNTGSRYLPVVQSMCMDMDDGAEPWSTQYMEDSSGDMSVDVVWEPSQTKSEALGALIKEAKQSRKLSYGATWSGNASTPQQSSTMPATSPFASTSTSTSTFTPSHLSSTYSSSYAYTHPRPSLHQKSSRHTTVQKPDPNELGKLFKLMEGVSTEVQSRTRKIVQDAETAAAAIAAQQQQRSKPIRSQQHQSRRHASRHNAPYTTSSKGADGKTKSRARTGMEMVSQEGRVSKAKTPTRLAASFGDLTNNGLAHRTRPASLSIRDSDKSLDKGKTRESVEDDIAPMDVDSPLSGDADTTGWRKATTPVSVARSRVMTKSDMGPPPVPPSRLQLHTIDSPSTASGSSTRPTKLSSTSHSGPSSKLTSSPVDDVPMDVATPNSPPRLRTTTSNKASRVASPPPPRPSPPQDPSSSSSTKSKAAAIIKAAKTTTSFTRSQSDPAIKLSRPAELSSDSADALGTDMDVNVPSSSQPTASQRAAKGYPPVLGMRRYPTPSSSAPRSRASSSSTLSFAASQTKQKPFRPPFARTTSAAPATGSTSNSNATTTTPAVTRGNPAPVRQQFTPDWSPSPAQVVRKHAPSSTGALTWSPGPQNTRASGAAVAGDDFHLDMHKRSSSPATDESFGDISFDPDALEAVCQKFDNP